MLPPHNQMQSYVWRQVSERLWQRRSWKVPERLLGSTVCLCRLFKEASFPLAQDSMAAHSS